MARAAPDYMHLSIHQSTSAAAGYRGSLDGWARAGIRYVELSDSLLDRFLEHDTLPAARRVLTDLGLTPVSTAALLQDIWIPGPERTASLETWRRRCDQFASLGLDKIYAPSMTTRPVTAEDFWSTPWLKIRSRPPSPGSSTGQPSWSNSGPTSSSASSPRPDPMPLISRDGLTDYRVRCGHGVRRHEDPHAPIPRAPFARRLGQSEHDTVGSRALLSERARNLIVRSRFR